MIIQELSAKEEVEQAAEEAELRSFQKLIALNVLENEGRVAALSFIRSIKEAME